MQKIFVLDTNVLLHSASALDAFADNVVAIPLTVIEELDGFKKKSDELARNARAVIRRLDAFRKAANQWRREDGRRCSLMDGVENPAAHGGPGKVQVFDPKEYEPIEGLDPKVPDNQILRVACGLRDHHEVVVLVSKDMNLRIKADVLDIEAQDFETDKVNADDLYPGMREAAVPRDRYDAFLKHGEGLEDLLPGLYANEGVRLLVEGDGHSELLVRVDREGKLRRLEPMNKEARGIRPRSPQQRLALELLLDPEVSLVTLVGGAGTGKTLLALAAGLEMVRRDRYNQVLVSRPIMPLGKDIGFLPGGKDDKLGHWMQPIYDNLASIPPEDRREQKNARTADARVAEWLKSGAVALEAITYIRGRSIPDTYMIVDEAQNLTPHEVKTVVSRAGEGTKVILTGDPDQIDNPYLDSASNGLSYAVERMKGVPLAGHVTLRKSERSPLAAAAAERM